MPCFRPHLWVSSNPQITHRFAQQTANYRVPRASLTLHVRTNTEKNLLRIIVQLQRLQSVNNQMAETRIDDGLSVGEGLPALWYRYAGRCVHQHEALQAGLEVCL